MYFWNIKKLKAQLIARPLTERETLPYIIATALTYLMMIEITIFGYSINDGSAQVIPYGIWDYVSVIFSIVITIFGSIWLFNKNKQRSENYFLQRYTALGWVVIVRTTSFILLLFILLFGLAQTIESEFFYKLFDSSLTGLIISQLLYVFFYWYFGKHLTEVAEKASYD
jgi:NADH:ubiquinone oxidoreductase subunit 2 (subunit N)